MLNRLPAELLRLIIEQLAPLECCFNLGLRQQDLATCCLVNHTFRSHAQPMLEEVIYCDSAKRFKAVEQAMQTRPAFLQSIRTLSSRQDDLEPAAELVRMLPQVEGVRFFGSLHCDSSCFALSDLSGQSNRLRHLSLNCCVISPTPGASLFTFPCLQSLTLYDVVAASETLEHLVLPTVTPALRVLYLYSQGDWGLLFPLLQSVQLDRLESLQVEEHDSIASLYLQSLPYPVLYLVELPGLWADEFWWVDALDQVQPQYLQVAITQFSLEALNDYASIIVECLDRFVKWLSTSTSLKQLLLSSAFQPAARGVEVVWRSSDIEADERVNLDFWRYARRVKEEKAKAQASS
ncbi:hypothetical protein JCM8097_004531 [Rhodosporidiobolus ruineniae]